jgi:hypothetical protein
MMLFGLKIVRLLNLNILHLEHLDVFKAVKSHLINFTDDLLIGILPSFLN